MLTASKLEQIIELENNLKEQYQSQLDAKDAEIAGHIADKERFIKENEALQATIATQLEQISTQATEAAASKKLEQLNRELTNRSEKLQDEVSELKKRVKTLQKDIAQEREDLKTLKQYDPAKMKKNLDANKKKLAEKQAANDLMQKNLSKTKNEKLELEMKVKELEAKLAQQEESANTDEEESAAA